MARSIAFIRHYGFQPRELVRAAIVIGCALVLIFAGPFLPL